MLDTENLIRRPKMVLGLGKKSSSLSFAPHRITYANLWKITGNRAFRVVLSYCQCCLFVFFSINHLQPLTNTFQYSRENGR